MPGEGLLLIADRLPWIAVGLLIGAFLVFSMGVVTPQEMLRRGQRRKVVIVDDDPSVRLGLKRLIEMNTSFQIVGEAGDGSAALLVVDAVQPDVVVMDVKMAPLDGVAATREIKHLYPWVRVIGFSAPEDDPTGAIMRYAGASGYAVKGDTPDHIVESILVGAGV